MPVALFSVSDKSGLVEFAEGLVGMGWRFLASSGTAEALREGGMPVEEIVDYTGSPEILGGRVKTLHPKIHAGILCRDVSNDLQDLEQIGCAPIDLVAVNLYPFEEITSRPEATLGDAIENIDIGGVALMRGASKNYQRVTLASDPTDYALILRELRQDGQTSLETRRRLALKGFLLTSKYDAAISNYLAKEFSLEQETPIHLTLYPIQSLRYGENPHQAASVYGYQPNIGPLGGQILQGKALSYNNLLDLDAAWSTAVSFERQTLVIVKHLSPCGVASHVDQGEAFHRALAADPVSAFGGVVAANRPLQRSFFEALGDLFVECIAAPGFSEDCLEAFRARKNLRLLLMPDLELDPGVEFRSIRAGMLCQEIDHGDPKSPMTDWRIVTTRHPSVDEWISLKFAWKACQHVKSNAIVFARGEAAVGIGGGQPNRVDCVRIAAQRAGERSHAAVMASDAFFPFPDAIEEAARAGISAIIQPGGSMKDESVILAADQHGMAMVFTGVRHFKH